ncbi:hypothetical protein COHA_008197 [Chlorella ohadii]|uniref:O-fucosyltransferase family protein n=1 Tax=Chlorella ohadii TaxID=2649997 RepID=A0AAD5DJC3_9CHLO|nr:hypothetical protein COHA_008197 [Chlorella ohadii]
MSAGGSAAGVTAVIATVRGSSGSSKVQAQLALGRSGRLGIAPGTAATPRSRPAALREAAKQRQRQQQQQQQLHAGREGGPDEEPLPTGLPPDFDAQVYLLYHPELKQQGIDSPAAAARHYLAKGRAEGRPYKRLRVLLRYTACTGLINQHYSHIAAFTLAAALGAELVLPPAVCRDSFAHYFSVYKEKNEVQWSPVPLDALLDVDGIIAYCLPISTAALFHSIPRAERGMAVHRTPALKPFPDLTQPEVAFPRYPAGDLDPNLVVRLEDVYLKALDLGELMDRARQAVVGHARGIRKDDLEAELPYVVLDLPCSFFSLRSLSNLPMVTEVARSLAFAPRLHAMADRVVAALTDGGRLPFNGVHLRVEKDARDWASIMGGTQVVWSGYLKTMRAVGFNSSTRLYAASGMLTYGASDEMARVKNYLIRTGLCSEVHHKEQYIPQKELEALNSEQKALLDFLVLARADRFAGFGSSTFSFYLREYRALQGIARKSSGLVDASIIGTDSLFHSAGTVV